MTSQSNPSETILHATSVAIERRGLLILGPSGSGKSSLALQLMALGALLIADDQTRLVSRDGQLIASAPAAIAGMVEARGIGLLYAAAAPPTPIHLAVDLGQHEVDRLPTLHHITVLDVRLPLVLAVDGAHFPAALLQLMRAGRRD